MFLNEIRSVYMAPVKARLILADDMKMSVGDARMVHVVGNPLGAVEVTGEIIHTLHGRPPDR